MGTPDVEKSRPLSPVPVQFALAAFVRSTFLKAAAPHCGQDLASDQVRLRRVAARTEIAHDDLVDRVPALIQVGDHLQPVPRGPFSHPLAASYRWPSSSWLDPPADGMDGSEPTDCD